MDFDLPGGKYVVAVSGGVDSVVLLHALLEKQRQTEEQNSQKKTKNDGSTTVKSRLGGLSSQKLRGGGGGGYELVVAHFDHGIREDSAEDRRFVENMCRQYGVPFLYDSGHLGAGASEDTARKARYNFLHRVRENMGADAVVTAHHQDDVLETIIMNLLRGTGSRGLHSLKSTDVVKRPMTHLPKRTIHTYAKLHRLPWREDSTNSDETYLRNYVRHQIVPKIGVTNRQRLLKHGLRARDLQEEIDTHTAHILHLQPHVYQMDRMQFVALPHAVSRELMATWLRTRTGVELSAKLLERLVLAAKSARAGAEVDVARGWRLRMSRDVIELRPAPVVAG